MSLLRKAIAIIVVVSLLSLAIAVHALNLQWPIPWLELFYGPLIPRPATLTLVVWLALWLLAFYVVVGRGERFRFFDILMVLVLPLSINADLVIKGLYTVRAGEALWQWTEAGFWRFLLAVAIVAAWFTSLELQFGRTLSLGRLWICSILMLPALAGLYAFFWAILMAVRPGIGSVTWLVGRCFGLTSAYAIASLMSVFIRFGHIVARDPILALIPLSYFVALTLAACAGGNAFGAGKARSGRAMLSALSKLKLKFRRVPKAFKGYKTVESYVDKTIEKTVEDYVNAVLHSADPRRAFKELLREADLAGRRGDWRKNRILEMAAGRLRSDFPQVIFGREELGLEVKQECTLPPPPVVKVPQPASLKVEEAASGRLYNFPLDESVEDIVAALMNEREALEKLVEDYELAREKEDHNMQNKLEFVLKRAQQDLDRILKGEWGVGS